MHILIRIAFLFLTLTLSAPLGLAEAKSGDSKLDPSLKMLKLQTLGIETAKAMNMIKEKPDRELRVRTIVKFVENLNGVESLGGEIRSVIGDIAAVDIPLSSLEALSEMENISYIEVSKKVRPSLDISVPETGADKLRSGIPPAWTGATGKGVIIGLVDTGIDFTHHDFKDSTGKTRILYLIDQTTNRECTSVMIDNRTCDERDTDGHGTHVAGISSGNGSAFQYRYIGMAPEANLIVVKTTFDTQDILNGISYIEQKAASLGMPCVINLSLGGDVDPHDGTSNYSKALDNASGPGRIIVGAAGNEAEDSVHASGFVSQGSQTPIAFNVPPGTPVTIDIWYSGSDSMNIEVSTPGCGDTGWIAPGDVQTLSTACGKISVSSGLNNPNNGDKEILLTLTNPRTGTWNFYLFGNAVTNGRFDAWTDESATFLNSDSSITISDTGSTTRVISAGSYVTRPLDKTEPSAGDISAFSSHGPRRLCSICNDVQKPDIAAPGQWIMSAFSKNTASPDLSLRDPSGGPYIMMQGTSMAAPHVSGAVALMLQKNATLTPEDIKNYLSSTAGIDSYTGIVPNNIWGFGKLDAYSAFSAVPSEAVATPTIDGPTTGDTGIDYTFSVSEASSNLGYNIQYFFDWGDGTNSGWLPAGSGSAAHLWNLPGTYPVRSQARSALDTAVVSSWSSPLPVDIRPALTLQSPSDSTSFDACSLYNLPAFSWNTEETFKGFEIQFSSDEGFSSVPVRVKLSPVYTETMMKSNAWKKVLLIPGNLGGTVYWRTVGTMTNKALAVSDARSIIVQPPQSLGNPDISNTGKSSLPTLSWANNCNTNFKVWFGNDPDFTIADIKKKALVFTAKPPDANGGIFTKQLTAGQWTSIRKLVGDISGSNIYWYVESSDALKRPLKTEVMNFVLTD